MKILHVIGSMDPATGGICQAIRNIDEELNLLGCEQEIVSLDDPTSPFLTTGNLTIHALGPSDGTWQYSSRLQPWLVANICRFDAVIINGLWIYPSYAVWKSVKIIKKIYVKKLNNKENVPPIFVMPHGMLDPYFQRFLHRKLKAVRNWFYWFFIENKVVNDADGLLFTCKKELELAAESFNWYRPKKEINVGFGIIEPPLYTLEMNTAFQKKCAGINDNPYFLFMGRIHKKKGVDLLIKSYASLLRKAGKEKKKIPKLVIAGPGIDTPFGQKMVSLTSSFEELQDMVFFPGMLADESKWGALYGCDVFILPSHQENFGIAVVEAMACQKPVLISNQININLEISSGKGGIVEPDTVEGTKKLLGSWLKLSVKEQFEMGANARNVYEKKFHIKPYSATFLKAITKF